MEKKERKRRESDFNEMHDEVHVWRRKEKEEKVALMRWEKERVLSTFLQSIFSFNYYKKNA